MNTSELRQLVGKRLTASASKRLQDRCSSDEVSLLYELVHLYDNVKSFFTATHEDIKIQSSVDNNEDFKLAANFVNSHKHGPRGRNQKSSYISCYLEAVEAKGNDVVDIKSVINYNGKLTVALDLAEKLIDMWNSFLEKNSDLNLINFKKRIVKARRIPTGMSLYIADIPMEGLEKWAKQESDKRKKLDIR
jgi:hypothetical protein